MAGAHGCKGGVTDGDASERQGLHDMVILKEVKDLGFLY